jgi:hypothetical protein
MSTKSDDSDASGIYRNDSFIIIILNFSFQPYRYVDNIMFENGNMANRFLNYWRSSGHQRVGILYGRYEVYDGVPLGVRAVVAAIYEPPQVAKIILS